MEPIRITHIEPITLDVLRIVTQKPIQHHFTPGQAAEIAINKPRWENELRPFTFTSLPQDDFLEFTIKTYPEHEGVTQELRSLHEDDELLLHEVFGAIAYKGEGIFIAGGAGVTPFISIFKQLEQQAALGNNKLLFANKTEADIIYKNKFEQLLGPNFINILSQEDKPNYAHGYISADLIKPLLSGRAQYIYLCGPDPMMEAVEAQLHLLGISDDRIVKEAF